MSDKCWVLLNDNGGTSNQPSQGSSYEGDFGPTGFQNSSPRYADASLTRYIPNIPELDKFTFTYENNNCTLADSYENTSGISQSRLWTYDVTDNNMYFADTLPYEGPDIGMGNNTFIVGCEIGIKNRTAIGDWSLPSQGFCLNKTNGALAGCMYTNLTLNQYEYSYSAGSEPNSFGKTPIKTFRIVDENGQLIGLSNSTTATETGVAAGKSLLGSQFMGGNAGFGASIGYISDGEVLVDDRAGNIWYVNLKNYYMGGQVYSHENGVDTPHPNNPGTYTDMTTNLNHVNPNDQSINGFNLESAWAACSHSTQYKVYTVEAKKVIDLNYSFLQHPGVFSSALGVNNKTVKTQGDLTFIAIDDSQGGIPTVAVTITNPDPTTNSLQPQGLSLAKYPIDLDNFVVQTTPIAQIAPIGNEVLGDPTTPSGSIAIVKEPSTSLYYLIAAQKRYLAAITTSAANFFGTIHTPIHVDTIGVNIQYYFWTSSMGQLIDNFGIGSATQYECGIASILFRGGSQPPDCVYPNAYTYNCTINGCESVFSSSTVPAGQFATLDACTGQCLSYSCNSETYDCFEVQGTGQTETYIMPDDCNEFCLPPYWLCGENGCISGTPTNFVFSSITECQQSCETYNCTANGCLPQIGSGGTYTAMTSCTASCYSYEISCLGATPVCEPFNPPYYGTGGTFTGASANAALIACTAATATTPCVSWVCNEQSVAENTDIYVYYDTTSMSFSNTVTAHNAIMQWTTTIPGWSGNIYHTPMSNERWLGWAGIPYHQPTSYGLRDSSSHSPQGPTGTGWGANNIIRSYEVIAWGQSQSTGAYWYDAFDPAFGPIILNQTTSNGTPAGTYNFRGYPPYAGGSTTSPDYTVPVLNVIFADESDSTLTNSTINGNEDDNTAIYYDVNRVSANAPTWAATANNAAGNEPTQYFQNDYNRWISIWNTIQANGGTVASFVYPTKPVNYANWGSGTKMVFKHMALSVLASISSGNMNQYIDPGTTLPYPLDGLWSAGTAPRMSSFGGTIGGTPGLCSIANLTQLETQNVYWDSGFGGLDQYGFGTNIEFPTYTYTQFQTDLDSFVTGGQVTVSTGCTSAATSVSTAFPFSSQTDCLNFCTPMYECTTDGCILNSTGGTFLSMSACTASCQSWSCTTVGCDSYNSPAGGTGGTFTALIDCQTGCTSWSCAYVPPSLMNTQNGCVEYIGSGQTYSAESACTATCISWDCSFSSPCISYPNTAHTFSTEIECTGSTDCSWWQCQVGGCIQQSGSYVVGVNNYITEQACKDVCFGWGCSQNNISSDTNIYAFYDTSSMTLSCVQNAHNSLMSWINTLPNYTGNTYHVAIDDERWLDWGNSVYSGTVKNGLQTPNLLNNFQNLQIIQWGSTTSQAANWYDNMVPGTTSLFGIGNITTKGLPPTTSVTGKTLIINFIDESAGVGYIDNSASRYHGGSGVVGNIPQFSGGSNITEYQPTSGWSEDYTAWTNTYAAVIASGGTTQGFMYPTQCNTTQMNTKKTFALQVVASITAGDQPTPNGTFSASTYPRTLASGGVQGGVPELCGIADLQMLSITNPYYSAGTGNLAAKGWGYNIDFLPFNSTQFQNDLGSFLTQTSTSATPGECVSAETLWHQSITHPYSCETCSTVILANGTSYFEDNCCSCNCIPPEQLYVCTTTGCSLSALGTLTWDQCNNPNLELPCISYSCTTDTGCEDYNFPNPQMLAHNGLTSAPTGSIYPNPVGGTGGTFTMLSDCYRLCSSYNCFWDPINMSINQDGCLPQLGTGGTYYNELQQTLGTNSSYSACTADCKSWECNNPCGSTTFPTPIVTPAQPALNPVTGCTQYPNTGATHLTEITCTASCEEHWYCFTGAGMTFLQNCLNATSTGIISNSFEGQITAIGNNSTWQTTQFGNLRWDMTGNYFNPSPTIASTQPLPVNPCEATAGHWARIISVSHSQLGLGTQYYTWATFIDALNTLPVSPPLQYTDGWQDVINAAGPHIFCEWEWCNCDTPDCLIGCIDELPLPAQTHGAYTSSTAATEVCCTGATATTWSCQTSTQADSCDGLTLIPGTYNFAAQAYDYMSINLATNTFSGYQYENTAPPAGTTGCAGPNGGQLYQLTGITLNNSILQNTNYTSWSSFIAACQAVPAPDGPILGLVVGMPSSVIVAQIQSYSAFCASDLVYGTTECICTNSPCNCIELLDGTGTYTSQTECQLVCCNSGTSWNCQNGMPYAPNCSTKDYLGMFNDDNNAMDYFRVNSGNTQFGLSKIVLATPNLPGVNPLTWAQVQSNMGVAWNWQDCYYNLPGTQDYYPYQYMANISHPNVNGGQTYNTWQTFSGAVTTAGVTFNSTDSVMTVCGKIDNQIGGTGIGCNIETFNCCRQEPCYCYEIFSGGGTYNTQTDCQPVCCPPPPMGWDCTPPIFPQTIGTCLFVPYGLHATWNDCIQNCTGETSWNCQPGLSEVIGIDSPNCGAATTYINPGVPMGPLQALAFSLANFPMINYELMYNLHNSTFGAGTNNCIDPVSGYYYKVNIRPSWYTPGGIYDSTNIQVWSLDWANTIDYLNTTYQNSGNGSQTTTTPFFVGMTITDIESMMADTDPNYGITWGTNHGRIGTVSQNCSCTVTPCDCVEVSGPGGQYPTYADCIPPCCEVEEPTYDCEINGCIDPGGGYGYYTGATALQDCQDVCYEWVCSETTSINCSNLIPLEFYGNLQYIYGELNLQNIQPRTNVHLGGGLIPPATIWQWAQPNNPGNVIIDFFGNGQDQYSPYDIHLNTITGKYNMQQEDVSNYKMDTTTIGPESVLTGNSIANYCTSPHGKWWRPTGIGVVDKSTGAVLVSPQNTWANLLSQVIVDYPNVCVHLGLATTTANVTGCLDAMLLKQPYHVNDALENTPNGFALLKGELRLYGEGCLC